MHNFNVTIAFHIKNKNDIMLFYFKFILFIFKILKLLRKTKMEKKCILLALASFLILITTTNASAENKIFHQVRFFNGMLIVKHSRMEETRKLFQKYFNNINEVTNKNSAARKLEEEKVRSVWSMFLQSNKSLEAIQSAQTFIKNILDQSNQTKDEEKQPQHKVKYNKPFRWG